MRKRARQFLKIPALLALFTVALLALLLPACERPSKTPPPVDALRVMTNIKAGFNAEDKDAFTADFGDIMFTKGFTKDAYLDVIESVKEKYGNWKSETYLGLKDGAHEWRLKMEKGDLKLILFLNKRSQVTGLWFRWFTLWEKLGGK